MFVKKVVGPIKFLSFFLTSFLRDASKKETNDNIVATIKTVDDY